MKRVLLTGSGGFVGHHVLEHLLENTDWGIVATDSFRHRGKTSRIREVLDGRSDDRERVQVVVHDLRAPIDAQLAEEIGDVDYLVSVASESHVDRSIVEPRSFIENNVQLVLSLLEYAREYPVEKFLHIGTDEQFGPAPVGREHSEEEPFRPSNPYCLAPGTDVVTRRGLVPIEEVDPVRDRVVSRNRSGMPEATIRRRWQFSANHLLTITTREGHETISCTEDHRFFVRVNSHAGGGTKIEERRARELRVGDRVAVARKIPFADGAVEVEREYARLLGYFVADGSYSPRSRYVRLADQSREMIDFYRAQAEAVCGVSRKSYTGAFGNVYKHGTKDCWYLQFASETLRKRVDLASRANVMEQAMNFGERSLAAFIAGWIDGDGSVGVDFSGRVVSVVVGCHDVALRRQLKFLLRRLGVVAVDDVEWKRVSVTNARSIAILIRCCATRKWPKEARTRKAQRKSGRAERWLWARVQSIAETAYDGDVYDLEIEKHHNYIANYFLVHNSSSKAMQADACYGYWRTYGLPIGLTQTMNIIGERQDPEKFVPLVLSRVMSGETVPIHASAEGQPGSRFYLHARNQADALLFLLRSQPFPVYGEGEMGRWNVVGEREVDNLEMAQMIAEYAGRHLEYDLVNFHESRPGHDLRYALDGSKMLGLGWVPPVPLAESLERTVAWTLKNRRWLLPS